MRTDCVVFGKPFRVASRVCTVFQFLNEEYCNLGSEKVQACYDNELGLVVQ